MKTLLIEEITFSNNSNQVHCVGVLNLGPLSVKTKIQIDFHQLNILLNKMGLTANMDQIYTSMEEVITPDGRFYRIDLTAHTAQLVEVNELNEEMKRPFRICA